MSVGPTELILIVLAFLLLFGTRRLGDLGKGIGEGIRNFKRGISGEAEESGRRSSATDAANRNLPQSGASDDVKANEVNGSSQGNAADGDKKSGDTKVSKD